MKFAKVVMELQSEVGRAVGGDIAAGFLMDLNSAIWWMEAHTTPNKPQVLIFQWKRLLKMILKVILDSVNSSDHVLCVCVCAE